LGQHVIGCEKEESKIEILISNDLHFWVLGLEEFIDDGASNIYFKCIVSKVIDFIFILEGTPSGRNGKLNLYEIYDIVEKLISNQSFQINFVFPFCKINYRKWDNKYFK
jgi:UDP-glucose 6-dehydrogenase